MGSLCRSTDWHTKKGEGKAWPRRSEYVALPGEGDLLQCRVVNRCSRKPLQQARMKKEEASSGFVSFPALLNGEWGLFPGLEWG
jgi:hypothetical protein